MNHEFSRNCFWKLTSSNLRFHGQLMEIRVYNEKSKFGEPSFVQDLWQICFQNTCICFQIIIFAVRFQL